MWKSTGHWPRGGRIQEGSPLESAALCTATLGNPHCWDARMHPGLCSVAQSRLVLCNPLDWGLPASSVHGTSRQEYWSGSPFPPSGDLPYPGMEPVSLMSPASQADSLALSHLGSPNAPIAFPKYSCGLCTPSTPESHYVPIIIFWAVCPWIQSYFFCLTGVEHGV